MTVDELEQQLARLRSRYAIRFAFKSRITRDLALLEAMIADAAEIRRQAADLEGGRDVADMAADVLRVYAREREAILEAREDGELALEAALVAQRANRVSERYRRHFAGKPRGTRDLELLGELLDRTRSMLRELDQLAAEGVDVTSDREILARNFDLYSTEQDNIVEAQRHGAPSERGGRLGGLANAQFELYRTHFAGKPRASRRPELLERIVRNLEDLRREMARLKAGGLDDEGNTRNIEIVSERIVAYEQELEEIATAREAAGASGVVEALREAAQELMREYERDFAGQDRRTRDTAQLERMCDAVGHVEDTLHPLADDDDHAGAVLRWVSDVADLFDREWEMIRQAKAQ